MTITLNGHVYRSVRDLDGNQVVIVQRGRMWRLASDQDRLRVLAGLSFSPLRIVT